MKKPTNYILVHVIGLLLFIRDICPLGLLGCCGNWLLALFNFIVSKILVTYGTLHWGKSSNRWITRKQSLKWYFWFDLSRVSLVVLPFILSKQTLRRKFLLSRHICGKMWNYHNSFWIHIKDAKYLDLSQGNSMINYFYTITA